MAKQEYLMRGREIISCLCTLKECDRLHHEPKRDTVDYDRIRKMAMALIESAERTIEKSYDGIWGQENQKNKQEVVMEWIDAEDRLPEDDQMVLGTNINMKMNPVLCNYVASGNIFESYESFRCIPCDVTHWMPVPDQPVKYDA